MISNHGPSLEFGLGETADAIRETTARFAADKIAPIAARIDADNEFPRELWPQMGELGLHGVTVEEQFGGLGLGYLEHVVAMEEVSRASASVGLSYGAHSNLCVNQIRRWGTEEQLFSPMIVGWLAGVAGVIFFAVAVFLLLQRLGQATERAARVRTR